jgi:hypothetical protein
MIYTSQLFIRGIPKLCNSTILTKAKSKTKIIKYEMSESHSSKPLLKERRGVEREVERGVERGVMSEREIITKVLLKYPCYSVGK